MSKMLSISPEHPDDLEDPRSTIRNEPEVDSSMKEEIEENKTVTDLNVADERIVMVHSQGRVNLYKKPTR